MCGLFARRSEIPQKQYSALNASDELSTLDRRAKEDSKMQAIELILWSSLYPLQAEELLFPGTVNHALLLTLIISRILPFRSVSLSPRPKD